MNDEVVKIKRPVSITVICIIGFTGGIISIPLIFSSNARQIGSWYPPYLALGVIIGLLSMVGLWTMKKWAAFLYIGFVILNQIVLLAMGVWNIMALIMKMV